MSTVSETGAGACVFRGKPFLGPVARKLSLVRVPAIKIQIKGDDAAIDLQLKGGSIRQLPRGEIRGAFPGRNTAPATSGGAAHETFRVRGIPDTRCVGIGVGEHPPPYYMGGQ